MIPSATRVAYRYLTASTLTLSGGQRAAHLDAVWAMYQKSYAAIGMSISAPSGLLKYDEWHLAMQGEEPVAFHLFKRTAFGLKTGSIGSNGSSEGKAAVASELRTSFHKAGFYGEVSHKVRDIVLSAGAPVVCASFAPQVLGKSVDQVDDLEYRRNLEGVGMVQKVLVGRPRGVPTTNHTHPSCPVAEGRTASVACVDDFCDLDAHYAMM